MESIRQDLERQLELLPVDEKQLPVKERVKRKYRRLNLQEAL